MAKAFEDYEKGSKKLVKVRATINMSYQSESKKVGDVFQVPKWQVDYWMRWPDSGIEIVKEAAPKKAASKRKTKLTNPEKEAKELETT